jgi:hypothetical protein
MPQGSSLAHPKVSAFTPVVAARLRLDPAFVAFVFASDKPESFSYWCDPADEGWSIAVPDDWEAAYPLWSTNGNQTLLLRSGTSYAFAHGSHDDEDVDIVAQTVQGLLADLFITLWESDESEPALRHAAEFCGFRHLDEVLEFERQHNRDRDYSKQRSRFIARVDEQHPT